MLRRLTSSTDLANAASERRRLTDGSTDFSASWLASCGGLVIAQESGRHLEFEEAQSMAATFRSFGVHSLRAISNDALIADEVVYAVEATPEDLFGMSREFGGVNVLLSPRGRDDIGVLFTTDDFKLIAGPKPFLTGYAGDLVTVRTAFLEFAGDHPGGVCQVLGRAATYMDWIGP